MSSRYTETELQKIVRIGLDRIDQAVERVCAKYEAPRLPGPFEYHISPAMIANHAIARFGMAKRGEVLPYEHGPLQWPLPKPDPLIEAMARWRVRVEEQARQAFNCSDLISGGMSMARVGSDEARRIDPSKVWRT